MGFSTDYLYCFHYSGSTGYLIFCCQDVASIQKDLEAFIWQSCNETVR